MLAAVVDQILHPRKFPLAIRFLRVGEQPPLDLGPQKGMQPAQVDASGPEDRSGRRAPLVKRLLVGAVNRNGEATAFIAVGPLRRQHRPTGLALRLVAALVASAQPQRRVRQLGADPDAAPTIARIRPLPGQPVVEVSVVTAEFKVPIPTELMLVAEDEGDVAGRPLGADPARPLVDPCSPPAGVAVRTNSALATSPWRRCSRHRRRWAEHRSPRPALGRSHPVTRQFQR